MKNKKAAMEMSMGTIVTIILLVVMLVLGVFFIQKIFTSGSGAIYTLDTQVQSEIDKLFSEDTVSLAIYPQSRNFKLKSGDDPKGFAFSYKNKDNEGASYDYYVFAQENFDYVGKCGSGFNADKANSYLITNAGSFSLGGNTMMPIPELVLFEIPENSPACTLVYNLEILKEGAPEISTTIFVTIK